MGPAKVRPKAATGISQAAHRGGASAARGRRSLPAALFRLVEVPEQRYFGTVMQYFLIHPPDRVDEDILGVAAVRVGAPPDGRQRGIIGGPQCRAPCGGGLG